MVFPGHTQTRYELPRAGFFWRFKRFEGVGTFLAQQKKRLTPHHTPVTHTLASLSQALLSSGLVVRFLVNARDRLSIVARSQLVKHALSCVVLKRNFSAAALMMNCFRCCAQLR